MTERRQLIISSPYPENAAMAIVRSGIAQRRLSVMYGSAPPRLAVEMMRLLSRHPSAANRFLAKGADADLFQGVGATRSCCDSP